MFEATRPSAFFLVLALIGCDPPAECPAPRSTQSLIGGSDQASYLDPHSIAAIGKLSVAGDPSAPLVCTGTQIASDWVLSAAHCTWFTVEFSDASGQVRRVAAVHRHDALDLALLELEPSCSAGGVLSVASTLPSSLSHAIIAGYGVDESGSSGSLRFLEEPVIDVSSEHVVMNGGGRTGACTGDSGGPLLIVDDAGRVVLLGVLSFGDESCVGLDYYVRVDQAWSWIDGIVEEPR